ncbi:hypothetical protein [Candidatus Viridilinea mediisalina]|uniref:Uncharacterized protein n=1 Tax=Candidatus Viridilinea mediisalina TaxID=2024553 RepID=A0A2A6RKF3_9CHLR|nr:hypothetical protein [Candidatus Viridilinea mediisalina]PDW03369.1 hypothetical protein CJ255_09290 [Candidatus Viridilinea mediisalina]
MPPDEPQASTAQPSTATPGPRAIPVRRRIPCCVRRAQQPLANTEAHLRAAAVWAALLHRPEPE